MWGRYNDGHTQLAIRVKIDLKHTKWVAIGIKYLPAIGDGLLWVLGEHTAFTSSFYHP